MHHESTETISADDTCRRSRERIHGTRCLPPPLSLSLLSVGAERSTTSRRRAGPRLLTPETEPRS